jgi:hypothetical protein
MGKYHEQNHIGNEGRQQLGNGEPIVKFCMEYANWRWNDFGCPFSGAAMGKYTVVRVDAASCLKNVPKREKEKNHADNKRSDSECPGGVPGLEASLHGKGRLKCLVVAGGSRWSLGVLPPNLRLCRESHIGRNQ